MAGKIEDYVSLAENTRHVIYSDSLGVYLGQYDGVIFWSRGHWGGRQIAPTFTREQANQEIKGLEVTDFPKHRLIEVYPDLPDLYASQTAIANAHLPRWGE